MGVGDKVNTHLPDSGKYSKDPEVEIMWILGNCTMKLGRCFSY